MCNPVSKEEEEEMTTILYAQPYDISAKGFYFRSTAEYYKNAANLKNQYGDLVEEFEIQLIDGEAIDFDLAKAWGLSQCNLHRFFEVVDEWEDHAKKVFIVAVGECGESFDLETVHPNDFDVDIYEGLSMRRLAMELMDDGLFGDIPKHLENYIDYDAVAYDLSMDYGEANIGGTNVIFRCA